MMHYLGGGLLCVGVGIVPSLASWNCWLRSARSECPSQNHVLNLSFWSFFMTLTIAQLFWCFFFELGMVPPAPNDRLWCVVCTPDRGMPSANRNEATRNEAPSLSLWFRRNHSYYLDDRFWALRFLYPFPWFHTVARPARAPAMLSLRVPAPAAYPCVHRYHYVPARLLLRQQNQFSWNWWSPFSLQKSSFETVSMIGISLLDVFCFEDFFLI